MSCRRGVCDVLGAAVFGLAALTFFGSAAAQSAGTSVQTPDPGQIAGKAVVIVGQGFGANENVNLEVLHTGGSAEPGMGHGLWTVTADASGKFTTTWTINASDDAGDDFRVVARGGITGAIATAQFDRMAAVSTDKFQYGTDENATIAGTGFLPGEVVTLRLVHAGGAVDDGSAHDAWTVTADPSGNITTLAPIGGGDPVSAEYVLTAKGTDSGLTSGWALSALACPPVPSPSSVVPAAIPSVGCPTNLNSCTAHDVETSVVSAETLNGDRCDRLSDFLDLKFTIRFATTASQRYDLGVFLSGDGGTLNSGSNNTPPTAAACLGIGPQVGAGDGNADGADCDSDLFLDLDPSGHSPNPAAADTCGDLQASAGPVFMTVTASVSCSTIDAQHHLKVPSCRVWEQNANHTGACTSLSQAGTGSKCDCTELDFSDVLSPCATALCDDGNVCTTDSCAVEGSTAVCHHDPVAEGTSCGEGNICTGSNTCVSGVCTTSTALNCDDANPCTDDSCDPATGCVHTNNTNPCNDGNACTTNDTCGGGTCNGGAAPNCDDGNPCTIDSCNPASGCVNDPAAANGNPCTDGNACTGVTGNEDACENGTCRGGAPVDCNDLNGCTTDSCNPATGCVHTNNTNPCDDGNACTTNDTCGDGTCNGGAAPNCDDSNLCTTDSCNPATGCVHTNNTNPCDDGNACTTNDTCGGGTCNGGAPPNCDDGNPCTDDSCNPASGCVHTNNTNPCSDGNACTTGDTCGGGTCNGGAAPNCDDGNPCTNDSCNPASGCVHTNNTNPCNDGNACTTGDTCSGGACKGGAAPNCNDGNPCTTDSCNPASGCVHTNNTNPCDDGNACTTNDTCGGGTCNGGAARNCDDGILCTTDTCDPTLGCQHKSDGTCTTDPRTIGFWRRLCAGPHPEGSITQADVECVNDSCTFANVHTIADLCDRLNPNPTNDKCEQAESQLMASLLNTCQARLSPDTPIDSSCTAHTTAGQSILDADQLLCSTGRTKATCTVAQCETEELNAGSAMNLDTVRVSRLIDGTLKISWQPPYNAAAGTTYAVRRRSSTNVPYQTIKTTTDLFVIDVSATGSSYFEYEVVPVW